MAKLRVGVAVFEEFNPTDGGAFSYQDLLLKTINQYDFHPDIEIINIIFYNNEKKQFSELKKEAIYIRRGLGLSLRDKVKNSTSKYLNLKLTRRNPIINFFSSFVLKERDKQAEELLKKNNIDLIYYLQPEWEILNYPFIATHWDNCHKSIPPFPEVALDGMYEKRERYHSYVLNKALAILCESNAGVAEILKLNTYHEHKIKMVPIFAGEVINKKYSEDEQQETLARYKLQKEKYFLYPAQFWAHKNHYNLIMAFHHLISETGDSQLKLVLCGSDKGNFNYIKSVIKSLSLTDRILTPGFVSVKDLNIFYQNSLALTMPTFLGPSNMPLIEAAHLRCPVLCSDSEGHREILGNSTLYFKPVDAVSIKNTMMQVLDPKMRNELSESAYQSIQQSAFNVDNALQTLNKVFCELIPIRKTWGY